MKLLLLVLLQQLADELLGQLAGVAEELLVKLVADGLDVLQGVLLGLAQERRSTAEPVGTVSSYDLDENWSFKPGSSSCLGLTYRM